MNKVEILSPAGDYDCFLAAVKAGADAVYLGGNFSARAYAKNFTDEEILSAIDYAHLHGKKVYMTLNIVMKQEEFNSIKSYITPFYLAGLDGVIVQDIGLISYISKVFPKLDVHASTQMTITDYQSIKLLEEMGVNRVVLARELSLNEIISIKNHCNSELECFIHGALCYSYSGKCLMSSFIGGRSGNRGRCAGTCRLPFDDEYTLSCKDICTLNILPELINAGISSFKIEGRMKSPEYVAGVTGIYRKYVDLFYSSRDNYSVDNQDLKTLLKLYTRSGNCEGYYFAENGRDMITLSKPGYSKADDALSKDTYIKYTKSDTDIPVNFDFSMQKNTPVSLSATSGHFCVTYVSDIAGDAVNRPTTEDDITKQLKKVGGTDFKIESVKVHADDGLFIPLGKINEIRRTSLELLKNDMLKDKKRELSDVLEYNTPYISNDGIDGINNRVKLHAYVRTKEQAYAAIKSGKINILSVNFMMIIKDMFFLQDLHRIESDSYPDIYIIMPSIVRNDFTVRYNDVINELMSDNLIKGFVVDNYELLYYFKSLDFKGNLLCNLHMYALNRESIETLYSFGATRITTPVELNKAELLRRKNFGEDIIVYGYLPLMISAQCVQNTRFGCNKKFSINRIKDRYNKSFAAVCDCTECCSEILNSVPLSLHKDRELIDRLRPYSARLMFSVESDKEVSEIIDGFYGMLFENTKYEPDFEYTRGHLLRGVE